jgi:cytochrome c-type biogenesis protein CcmF
LLPWLSGTAFLHSVMIQEKRGMLKVWNVVLVITTFFLSIFGTFLTRSGIVSSVHAFAQSSIGPFFAVFLCIIVFF